MFLNEVCKSDRLKSTEILIKRLKETHKLRPNVMKDLRKLLTGYNGEKEMKYQQFLPEKDCLIIHNLRLYDGKNHFQIDYLILTQRFALIVECKNYYGEVEIDSNFNQMIRTGDEKVEGFSNPISQAKRHQRQLLTYFKQHNLPPLPIEFIVIFSNPSTIIKGDPSIKDVVIHSHSFSEKWDKLVAKYRRASIVDIKLLRKAAKNLLKNNTPETVDLLKKYGVQPSDLITGVQCPSCEKFAMIRQKRKWFCPHCNTYDKDAHHQTVTDYLLLIKATITNKEFRKFANVSSRETAAKMLVRMNLPSKGENKGRKYHKP